MKSVVWAFVALAVLVRPLMGQDHAFSKIAVPQDTVAAILERGDTAKFSSLFHIHPDTFVVGMNLMFSSLSIENWGDLGRYISTLERKNCEEVVPSGQEMALGRVRGESLELSGAWQRECKPEEVLLCDRELGWCPLSETCWNINLSRHVPPEWQLAVEEDSLIVETGGLGLAPPSQEMELGSVRVDTTFLWVDPGLIRVDPQQEVELATPESSWLDRHGEKILIGSLVVAVIVSAVCLSRDDHCFLRTGDQVVIIDGREVTLPRPRLGGVELFRLGWR